MINKLLLPVRVFILMVALLLKPATAAFAGTADSLKGELSKYTDSDTTKLGLLLSICDKYFYDNPDSLNYYARTALKLSAKHKYVRAISKSHAYIGQAYYLYNNQDSAMARFKHALALVRNEDMPQLKAFIYNNIGNVYLRQTNHKKALAYYDTVIEISQVIDDKLMQATAISNIASIYHDQGSYPTALKMHLQGLQLFEELKHNDQIETALLNIANVYFRMSDYGKAKQTMERALKMAEQSGSKWSVVSCLTTYAMIHNEEKHYDSSITCLNKALIESKELNNAFLTNILKGNLAEAYLKKGMLDSSMVLFRESLSVSEQLQDNEGIAIAKAGLGQVLTKKGQFAQGTAMMTEALEMMIAGDMKEEAKVTAAELADCYEQKGDYRNALKFNKIRDRYADSLVTDAKRKAVLAMEYDAELNKKEARITLLEKNEAIKDAKSTQQKILSGAALTGMLLAVIIALLVFRNLRNSRRHNELITQQKREIEEQAASLERLNNFKDTTFSVLSHDLRSPINALTGTMALLDEGIITPDEFKVYKEELNNKLQSVTLMLDNLLQWAKTQMKGENTMEPERINVKRKVLKSIAVTKDAAQQKNITLAAQVPENLFIYADQNQIAMVIRNLLSNAVKFTPQNGQVTITASRVHNMIGISVTDSGIGMTQEQAKNLFDGTPNASSHGTDGEKGTGIGLHLSYNFVLNNGGNISVESEQGKGTTFTVTLPEAT